MVDEAVQFGNQVEACGIQLAAGIDIGSQFVVPDVVGHAAALISCGIDNRYKHPHKEMLQRIEALGAASYRTDEGGAVIVKVDSMNMQIKSYCVSR